MRYQCVVLKLFINSSFFNLLDGQTPRTPTPFKNALAELERRSGATTQLPVTPSRLDALTEIIKQETDRESLAGTSGLLQDSGYSTGRRRGKENSAPGGKRARKALSQAWSNSNDNNSEMSFAVETPVRTFKQNLSYKKKNWYENIELRWKKVKNFLWTDNIQKKISPKKISKLIRITKIEYG